MTTFDDRPPSAASHTVLRPAQPGERCGCGREAVAVLTTERNGDIAICSSSVRPVTCDVCRCSSPMSGPYIRTGGTTRCALCFENHQKAFNSEVA